MATVTGMLALAAGYTSLLVSEREQNLVQDSAYNSVFGASQAATELMGLEAQVGRYGLKPTPTAKDDVQLRLAIMDNRLDVLSHGEIGAFIAIALYRRQGMSMRRQMHVTVVRRP